MSNHERFRRNDGDLPCPGCAKSMPVQTVSEIVGSGPAQRAMEVNDFTVCLVCGTVGRCTADLTLRHATATEFMLLMEDEPLMAYDIHKTSQAVREGNTSTGPTN